MMISPAQYFPSPCLDDEGDLAWSEPVFAMPQSAEHGARLALCRARAIAKRLSASNSELEFKIGRAWESLVLARRCTTNSDTRYADELMQSAMLKAQLALSMAVMLERREREHCLEVARGALVRELESRRTESEAYEYASCA